MSKKSPITICSSSEDDQIKAIVYPENSHYSFDCIRLQMTALKFNKKKIEVDAIKVVDMTPDEALEVADLLTKAVQIFLLTNKEYSIFIKKEKKVHGKKCGLINKN